ncbi:MAG: dihydrolipoyl dehydrogenase [Planctomycetes bacterium]|nr:dihydrolipoyl dehydrogenase [Planctomycetota bacterium]NOG56017.1 dihydrolipoyl dehydrogenase [Planctomycetota bacterium]
MADTHFDLIVIGGGPGGYVGAIRAAQLGMKTACIERDRLGGVCLNWGCIPTKALLRNAELYTEVAKHGADWGIEADGLSFKWDQVIGRSRGVADTLNKGIGFLFKKNGITHLDGHARITKGAGGPNQPCEVVVMDKPGGTIRQSLTADRILIATGAEPRELPSAPFDGQVVIAAKEAMTLPTRPERLVIVGGGAIGVEFAYFYNAFGTQVTIVEMLDHLLPIEDADIAKVLEREFKKSKISVKTGYTVNAVDVKKGSGKSKKPASASVAISKASDGSKSETIEADAVLVAIGVRGRFDGLFADSLNVETVKDHIKVNYIDVDNPTYATSVPGVYAIGDVIGPPWLAHVASEEAVACVERMAGHECLGIDYTLIPGCTYCHPQVASIGRNEQKLKDAGLSKGTDYEVGSYQLKAHGKAIAAGANVGMVKVLTAIPNGEILGAHIIGDQATELISEFGLAMHLEATIDDVINTLHAHPTMYEANHEAALAARGRLIHG